MKLIIFLLLIESALNTIVHNQVVLKTVVEKINFSDLKIKIKSKIFLLRVQPKLFAVAFLTSEVA